MVHGLEVLSISKFTRVVVLVTQSMLVRVSSWIMGDPGQQFSSCLWYEREHYWGLGGDRDNPDPKKNLLIKIIRKWEEQGHLPLPEIAL